MENKIKKIMSQVFDIKEDTINLTSSPDNIENWDSLRHLNLITALEEEFEVRFTYEQIIEMLTFTLIIKNINEILK